MDASSLEFDSNAFNVVICLQQVLCFIEDSESRLEAFRECYRVLKPEGLLIGSFLHYMGRWYNPAISLLSLLPKMTKKEFNFLNRQYLPWLKQGDSINFSVIWEKQPYLYWFDKSELEEVLRRTGFRLRAIKSSIMFHSCNQEFRSGGMLYVVAQK